MLTNYFKTAIAVFRRRPFFTAVSLFGTTFTLLVLIVATAMIDHTFGEHPPETRLERTLGLYGVGMYGPQQSRTSRAGLALIDRTVRNLPRTEAVTVVGSSRTIESWVNDRKVRSDVKPTDAAFWRVYDVQYLEGGSWSDADDAAGRRVAVINESTRSRIFGDVPAVGLSIDLDGRDYRVIGVVRNIPATRHYPSADIWIPLTTLPGSDWRNELHGSFTAIVVAESSADFGVIRAAFAERLRDVPLPEGFTTLRASLDTLFEWSSRAMFGKDLDRAYPGRLAGLMLTIALLFMILPAINLINLNLSRTSERRVEIGVRKAFGASSRRLVGQFVFENVLLAVAAGLVSILLGAVVLQAIDASEVIPYSNLTINWRIFLGGLAFAVVFGVLSGAVPAWRMSRLHPAVALKGGAR